MEDSRLTTSELINLVRKICDGENHDEEELDKWLLLVERNVPHPEVCDLIFRHTPELTPEEIIEKALSYKPLITPPPQK